MSARFRFVSFILITTLLLAACAPGLATPAPASAQPSATLVKTATLQATQPPPQNIIPPSPSATSMPLPTATLPPTSFPAGLWVGAPTYPGDSKPGMYFSVDFDPAVWELQEDPSGLVALANQQILGCVMATSAGRGLPPGLIVDHESRTIGALDFEVNRVFDSGGKLQFVTYQGGDVNVYTSFEVRFQDQPEVCVQAAEGLLATLGSIPQPAVTPTVLPPVGASPTP